MRHRVPGLRLSRAADQRKAVIRALATELLRHDEITTTLPKAKAVRSHVEKLITLAREGYIADYQGILKQARQGDSAEAQQAQKKLARALHLRRQAAAFLYDRQVVKKLFDVTAPRYLERGVTEPGGKGGYTRIIRLGSRRGDNADMALIQLV